VRRRGGPAHRRHLADPQPGALLTLALGTFAIGTGEFGSNGIILGAIGGALTIDAGWGPLSTVWAGFALTPPAA
jgi:predicted MFS family arabinose efflux permease